MEPIKPTYKFVAVEGMESVSPIKRTIAKTMVTTENFNIFETMTYIARMKKAITDKEAEIAGIKSMIDAYEDELKFVEESLGVQSAEEDYQVEISLENEKKQAATEAALKEELLKTGNFEEKV